MKILLTGHTYGLGKSIFDHLQGRGWHVVGFSRSNGFDIGDAEARQAIVDAACHMDVVINNAWSSDAPWAQPSLHEELIKGTPDSVSLIAIGTRATDWGLGAAHPNYEGSKDALHRFSRWATVNTDRRTLLIRPGLLDTPKFAHRNKPKCPPSTVAAAITTWIGNDVSHGVSDVTELVFSPKRKAS